MSEEKKFVDGLFVKEKTLKYGPITELSFKVEEFTQWMKEYVNDKGYVNVTIKKAKESGKPYAELNDWKPEPKDDASPRPTFEEPDDLPF